MNCGRCDNDDDDDDGGGGGGRVMLVVVVEVVMGRVGRIGQGRRGSKCAVRHYEQHGNF